MDALLESVEVEAVRAGHHHLAVDHGALGKLGSDGVDHLGEVPGEWPFVTATQLDLVAVAEGDATKPVPLGLVEKVAVRNIPHELGQHRGHGWHDGQIHRRHSKGSRAATGRTGGPGRRLLAGRVATPAGRRATPAAPAASWATGRQCRAYWGAPPHTPCRPGWPRAGRTALPPGARARARRPRLPASRSWRRSTPTGACAGGGPRARRGPARAAAGPPESAPDHTPAIVGRSWVVTAPSAWRGQ